MQKLENRLLTVIHDFFLIYLPSQRKSSPHTVKAYQTTIEKASAGICEIDAGESTPDTLNDDTLKRLYGLR